jgi:hypothetical protein
MLTPPPIALLGLLQLVSCATSAEQAMQEIFNRVVTFQNFQLPDPNCKLHHTIIDTVSVI